MKGALVAAAAALALLGCAAARLPRVPGDPPPAVRDAQAEGAYQEILARHTKSVAVYDNLDTKVFFRATWQSPAFAQARVRREGLFKALPPAELDARLLEERERLADATEFFVAVHANDYRFDDLEKKDSMWRVVLVAGGEELKPTRIDRLGRTNTELRSYYSYLENFWVGYRVRFPRRELGPGERFSVKLASAVGQTELPFTAE